ncbi:MAG: DNA photolyase family protein [Chloroflexaceae bacterium]|jgi:deoxyribodipyrimidine photo-lyase|nr:DNA photolyase family protein [Chloroflexaceae bacterium]
MPPLIHWFRRDLRLNDNTALSAAASQSGGAVVPVFILDDRLISGETAGPARTRFMLESLRELDAGLRQRGSRLIFRRGDPQTELLKLVHETGAAGVFWNRDYTPFAIRRDSRVKQALREAGHQAESFKDLVIFEMGEVKTNEGKPFTVYTPYSRRWRQQASEAPPVTQAVPQFAADVAMPDSLPIPDLADLGMHSEQRAIPGGESHAQQLLREFTDTQQQYGISHYKEQRNFPGLPATSRLSAHLHIGTASVRQCLAAAVACGDGSDVQAWIGELAWRDFYMQILYHFPHVATSAFRPAFNGLQWENDQQLFAAWCEGRTGYPIVDAAMRQMNTEAWMHNRCRMITASFLCKDLLIDWRLGELYFWQKLVDGDKAANNGGWQWAAGTGTDAQPFFRIFNPTSQGQQFDPQGAYVRRYVPELVRVPDSFIHEPWKMSANLQEQCGVVIGRDYPAPIVDHAVQRQRALALYGQVKK